MRPTNNFSPNPLRANVSAKQSRELPLFAQPLEKPVTVLGVSRSSGRNLVIAVAASALCLVFLTLASKDDAQNSSSKMKSSSSQKVADKTDSSEKSTTGTETERPSVEFYTQGIRSNLFSAPLPPAPKVVARPVVKVKPAVVVKPPIVKPVAPVIVNPFADWKYTGTVKMNDTMLALVENSGTKEGRYIRVNDSFDGGATVSAISDGGVTLVAAGKPYFIAKQQEGSLVPLNAPTGAAQPAPQGAPPAPDPNGNNGQNRRRGGFGGGNLPGLPPGAMITLPNGMQMPADQAFRRSGRLNRTFNQ